jgi:FAD/FMN-containing dehydrogenase
VATAQPDILSIDALRSSVSGRVIGPSDEGYDAARTVVMGGMDRRPDVIVKPKTAADVATVIKLVRETGARLAVKSGGHSSTGSSVSDGGVTIDLGDMRAIDVDAAARTAWVEAGATAAEVTAAADAHDLAIGFGDTGSVGVGGITTGGGVGYLVRKYGLTIDNLIGAEIVTADGEVRTIDAATEPDLFWAIRGGGGNFGVVTRFQFRLQQLGEIVGGFLFQPATPDVVAGFMAAAESASEDVGTILNVMPAPPMPMIAEEHHGKLVAMSMIVHAGGGEAGEQAVAPFKALATPLADLVGPKRYPEMFPSEEGGDYHPLAVARTMFMDTFDREIAADVIERLEKGTAMMNAVQLRVLGGAMARVPKDATAFAHRSSRIMVNVAAIYEDPAERPTHLAWVEETSRALQQGDTGAYVNFLAEDGPERIRNAYPGATYDRLAVLKRRYDPGNLFRGNQNIAPA